MNRELRIAKAALRDIWYFDDDIELEYGDPGERARVALLAINNSDYLDNRHPSSITLDEAKCIFKICSTICFDSSDWYLLDFGTRFEMKASERLAYFVIDWNNGFGIYEVNSKNVVKTPNFWQSLKIADYLDSIGITYSF